MITEQERKEILAARYNRIIRKLNRDLSGGNTFGLDWSTVRVLYPDRYATLKKIEAELDQ